MVQIKFMKFKNNIGQIGETRATSFQIMSDI